MPQIQADEVTELKYAELHELCNATEVAIREGIGFNWVSPPTSDMLESYWKGVLLVPERVLFIGRLDNVVAAAIQLVKPSPSKETSAFAASIEGHFVAPWARGHGLAKALLHEAEREARRGGFTSLRLAVRETQEAAIKLYEESGYIRWGTLPAYEFVNAHMVAGHFYYKNLESLTSLI